MRIVTLQTKDFKGLPNGVHEFELANVITGRNGAGKSSIAEALVFALYGRTRTGNLSTDDLIHESAESCMVALEFDTGTTVLREQSRFYGAGLKLNGEKTDQGSLAAALPDHQTFLNIFMPGYFMAQSESDQRSQLLSYSTDVNLESLFNKYTNRDDLADKYHIDFTAIDKESKKYKKREKDLKDDIAQAQYRKTYAEDQITGTKKPKARIDVKKTQSSLELHEAWDDYEAALQTNQRLGEQILAASKGRCGDCGQELPEDQRATKLKELNSRKVEATKPESKRPKTPAHELREKLSDAKATNALFDNYEEQILEHESQKHKATELIEKSQVELADISTIVEALSPKGIRAQAARKQIQPIVDAINEFTGDKLPVKIETLKPLKTKGDLKEVFILSANEVPYKFLSTGEKKRIDIALSQTINKLSKADVDMYFIDDAELISEEYTISGQVFKAYVTSNELTVKGE